MAARSRDKVTASETYVLLKDRGLPTAQQQQSFILAEPIYASAGTPDAGRFRGWLIMGLRGNDFLSQTLRRASQDTVAGSMLDESTPATAAVPVATVNQGRVLDRTDLQRTVSIEFAGTRWQLQLRPTAGFVAGLEPSLRGPVETATRAISVADRLLDQPTHRERGDHSVNPARRCLMQVDRFRCGNVACAQATCFRCCPSVPTGPPARSVPMPKPGPRDIARCGDRPR